MSEVRSMYDELTERLSLLGATDDEMDLFHDQWPETTGGERELLFRMNDARLVAAIRESREDAEFHSFTPAEAAERDADDAGRAESERLDAEAWDVLSHTVEGVLSIVGDDQALAVRLVRLESSASMPRVTLLRELQRLAGVPAGNAAAGPENGTQDDPEAITHGDGGDDG